MSLKKLIAMGLVTTSIFVVGCSSDTKTESVENSKVETTEKTNEQAQQDETKEESMNLVLVDNDVVKMTITGKYEDETFGQVGYNFIVENKTDKTIQVATDNISCDGIMQDDNNMFVWSIQPNKKSVSKGYFFIGNNGIEGIENLKNIEADIYVADEETYDRLSEFNIKID